MCMRLVLFVVNEILDSSELLSCLLLLMIEKGVEYCLVCITEGLLCGKGVEPPRDRGRLSGARESQLFFGVHYNKNVFKDIGSEYFVVYLSCVYIVSLYIYSAGYAELPVVLLYLLQCFVYHMLSKTRMCHLYPTPFRIFFFFCFLPNSFFCFDPGFLFWRE